MPLMPRSPILALLARGLAAFWSLAIPVVAQVESPVHPARLGDRFAGAIEAEGEVDLVQFPAVQGTVVTLKVKAGKGVDLRPSITIRDAESDAIIEALGFTKGTGTTTVTISGLALPATGLYLLEIAAAPGGTATGEYSLSTQGKLAKSVLSPAPPGPAEPGESAEIMFDALPGSLLSVTLVAPDADDTFLEQSSQLMLEGASTSIPVSLNIKGSQNKCSIKKLLVPEFGPQRIILPASLATQLEKVIIKVKPPKTKKAKLTEGTAGAFGSLVEELEAVSLTFVRDLGLAIGGDVGPVVFSTLVTSGAESAVGTKLVSYAPSTTTQVAFLLAADGEPIAPFAIQAGDEAGSVVTVDSARIGLGLVALHPAIASLPDDQREQVLAAAPGHESFAVLRDAIEVILAQQPLAMLDPVGGSAVWQVLLPLGTDLVGSVQTFDFAASDAPISTECGDVVPEGTFSVHVGLGGNAVLVNTTSLFYGVAITNESSSAGFTVVQPRELISWPPLGPASRCVLLGSGWTQITGKALSTFGANGANLTSAGGVGQTANQLYTQCFLLSALGGKFKALTPGVTAYLSPSGVTELIMEVMLENSADPEVKSMVKEFNDGPLGLVDAPEVITKSAEKLAKYLPKLSALIVKSSKGSSPIAQQLVNSGLPGALKGSAKVLGAFVKLIPLVELPDALLILADSVTLKFEPSRTYCLEKS